jgi:anti-sigma regulatory factor (Ser/Thr protein kinase)
MAESAWAQRPLPSPGPDAVLLRRWEPSTPADLTAHRKQLAAALHDGARPPGADEGAVERLLLVFEELVSNALRHGHAPVRAEVTTFDHFWLIDVTDAAAGQPPTPAVGRDAAHGGLGLYLVARLCGAYGWTVAGVRKHVWARIDYTRAEAPGWVPRPRRETDGHSSSV